MKVAKVIEGKGSVHSLEADAPIKDAAAAFAGTHVRSLVVVEGGKLAGILTLRDLVKHLANKGGPGMEAPVREAMTRQVTTVTPDTPMDQARQLFLDQKVNHLPVVDDGNAVLGVITLADVLGFHLGDQKALVDALQQYIHGPSIR